MNRKLIDPALQHEMTLPWREPDHLQAFRRSCALTRSFYRHHRTQAVMIEFEEVVKLLCEAKIHFVLAGLHGISGWRSETRATGDVDVIVTKRDHKKAIRVLQKQYPELVVMDTSVVTRFVDRRSNSVVIDVMKPSHEALRLVFRNAFLVGKKYRIPDLEMALVLKFVAMMSSSREMRKKYTDGGDFADIVQFNESIIDMDKLTRLADRVRPHGGEKIRELVETVLSGEPIRFTAGD